MVKLEPKKGMPKVSRAERLKRQKAREEELAETLLKFKANDREVERERRHQAIERDRETKYAKKLADWLDRE